METRDATSGRLTASLILGAVLTVGLVARAAQLRESLWLDELHTAWTISDTLADVAPRARMGNNSPLYFYLPWLTTRWLGMSEVAVRLPSLLAGVALIGVVYGVAYSWTGHRSMALMAAALAALDRNFLFYSLEARPYVLVQLIGVLHVVVFWRLICRPSVRLRVVWIAGAVLLFYLHYTAALLIPAQLVYYLIARFALRDEVSYRWHQLLTDLGLVVLACLPASRHLMLVASRRENWQMFVSRRTLWSVLWIFPLSIYVVLPLIAVATVAIWRRVRSLRPLRRAADKNMPPLTLPSPLPFRFAGRGEGTGESAARPAAPLDYRLLLLVVCWLFVPLCLAWLTTQADVARLLFRRYLMVVSVAPVLLSALIGSLCCTRAVRVGVAVLVVLVGGYWIGPIPQLVRDGRLVNHGDEDWRRAVQTLNADNKYGQLPVFVCSGLIEADALRTAGDVGLDSLCEYCLLPVRGVYRLTDAQRAMFPMATTNAGRLDESQWQTISRARGAWLVVRGDDSSIDRMLKQLRQSAAEHDMQMTIATRQAFVRPTDVFGLHRLLVGEVAGEGSAWDRRRATVTRIRLQM